MLIETEAGRWVDTNHVWQYRVHETQVKADVALYKDDDRCTVVLATCDSAEAAEQRLAAIVCEVARATRGMPTLGMASVEHIDSLCR